MAYIGSGNTQTYGLTYRKPKAIPYSDILSSMGSDLYNLYAAKDTKEARERELALQEKGLEQSKELSEMGLAQSRAELEKQQEQWNLENAASVRTLEQNRELAEATAKEVGKQNTIANVIGGGANTALNAYTALKGAGWIGGGAKTPGATDYGVMDFTGSDTSGGGIDWGSLGINTATGALTGLGAKYLSEKLGASKGAANAIAAATGIASGVSGIGKSIFNTIAGYI